MWKTIARVWFGTAMTFAMLISATVCKVMSFIPESIMSKKTRQGACLVFLQHAWYFCLVVSPWVRMRATPAVAPQWAAFVRDHEANNKKAKEEQKPAFILSNHSSFLDTIIAVAVVPPQVVWYTRTYLSSHLFNLPLLSTICKALGHFPVHFTASEYGKFTVDREKMDQVQVGVDAHLKDEGILAFFPEGQMNKTPDTLCDFRYGGFKKALDVDARLWTMTTYGCPQAWPAKAQMGGFPVNGAYDVRAFAPQGCKKKVVELRKAHPGETKDLEDEMVLALYARLDMQGYYDSLKASCTGNGKTD